MLTTKEGLETMELSEAFSHHTTDTSDYVLHELHEAAGLHALLDPPDELRFVVTLLARFLQRVDSPVSHQLRRLL